jgi:hypothetical protein
MIKKVPVVIGVLLALCVVAAAADVAGKWTAQVPGRGGETREAVFQFKVDGEKLTGTMSDSRGEVAIADGKVSGDTITFSVETQRGKRTYTGKVSGGEIKFKRVGGQGGSQEFTAKRVTT